MPERPQAASGGATDSAPRRRRHRPRKKRYALALVAGGAVVWLALGAVALLQARASAEAGRATLDGLRASASPSALLSGEQTDDLRRAETSFAAARARLRSPAVWPLRALPVLGRQVRSFDALAEAAGAVAGTGADALAEADELVGGGLPPGPERAQLLASLSEVAGRAERRLAGIDLGPDEALLGPLATARDTFASELEELRTTATDARVGTAGVAELLSESSTYLLLVGNNGEMRAGSGTFLTAGTLFIDDGRLEVGELYPTSDLLLAEGVPVEGDLADRWGWLEPGREWRNLGITPRFDVTAPLAARMWAETSGEEVDGVLAVDVVALQAVLAAAGPIEVEGEQLDAGNVVRDLLRDQYAGFEFDEAAQATRSPRLAAVTRAAVGALESEIDVADLATELGGASRGRHLLAWSPVPEVQSAWEAAGIDGALDEDDLLVAMVNRGGTKLDQYLDVDADLRIEAKDDRTEVTVELRVRNVAPDGEPPYVFGPNPALDVAGGTYVGLVAATLPGPATGGRFEEVESLAVAGSDGPTRVVAASVEIPQGDEQVMTLRFELPAGFDAMDVLPSARVPAVQWHSGDMAWSDDHRQRIEW
ncbi:MAG: DUF4012 domain-containing protein [Acidimicrobiales bacterium]